MSASSRLNDSEFIERQRSYFSDILCRRWACDEPEHDVCVLTADGGHFQLTEEQINLWVDVLCSADGSPLQPPDGLLPSGGQSSTSTPPQKESLEHHPADTGHIRAFLPQQRQFVNLWIVPPVYEILAVSEYLREGSYRRLYSEVTAPVSLARQESYHAAIFYQKDYYSTAVQRRALDTLNSAWRVDSWQSAPYRLTTELCKSYVSALTNNSPEQVRDNLIDALMKVPLEIHGDQAACAFISVLRRHVIYSPKKPGYTDSKEAIHFHILCMTVKRLLAARQLSSDEISMLWDLAKRRVERYTAELNPDRVRILYEVELFSVCAGQDSIFRDLFLSPPGIPRIVENAHMKVAERSEFGGLNMLLEGDIKNLREWSNCEWVANSDEICDGIIRLMFDVLREPTSTEIWFKLTWDVLGAIGALLDHRSDPEALCNSLRQGGGIFALSLKKVLDCTDRYSFQPYVDYCREEMSELLSRIATPSVDMAAQGEPQDGRASVIYTPENSYSMHSTISNIEESGYPANVLG
ncbi:hypothetical protein BU17DRAFT_93708 [Hysterangium stoloniferum]|nr:hypothetical protein BU17DRAFT_93708 [Hysterangium stoloniferum]